MTQDVQDKQGFTFHASLGELYRLTIERERRTLFGSDAIMRLYLVGPGGYEQVLELASGWVARRWTEVDADMESWHVEITERPDLDALTMARIAAVDLIGHGLPARFKVVQVDKPMYAGHVWLLRLVPTGEPIPTVNPLRLTDGR